MITLLFNENNIIQPEITLHKHFNERQYIVKKRSTSSKHFCLNLHFEYYLQKYGIHYINLIILSGFSSSNEISNSLVENGIKGGILKRRDPYFDPGAN